MAYHQVAPRTAAYPVASPASVTRQPSAQYIATPRAVTLPVASPVSVTRHPSTQYVAMPQYTAVPSASRVQATAPIQLPQPTRQLPAIPAPALARSQKTVARGAAAMDRTFTPASAKGGTALDNSKTAILFIEYQNEFTTEGGKLYPAVKEVMESNDMLAKSVALASKARAAGVKIMHAAITFKADASDNPNKGFGILAGCAKDSLFTEGTWNADFCESMRPCEGDVVITGKKGLDAFPGTDLEQQLVANGIETVVLAGFLTNCCVESTMRTAYEKGFNVITLTDGTATTSAEGQQVINGSFGMFSTPMTVAEYESKLCRTFTPASAKGGTALNNSKTAILFIEYQNEFTTEGGKLYPAVKEVMESNGMLAKSAALAFKARSAGVKIMHAAITFKADASDNPNKGLGILAGCAQDSLFTEGTWNADFCESMRPCEGDVVITGKKGLDAFPNTDLEQQLVANGIETVVLAGFLTNCCVESTMRTAYEKGFNVITLTDGTATTSAEGQEVTSGSFGMFSTPMTVAEYESKL